MSDVGNNGGVTEAPLNVTGVDPDKPSQYSNKLYDLGMEDPAIYESLGKVTKPLGSETSEASTSDDSGTSSPTFGDEARLTRHELPPAAESPAYTEDGGEINPAFEVDVQGVEQGSSKV